MKKKTNKKKTALITGITGQDGSYLAEFLISKNYIVHGVIRRSSSINSKRIDHIYEEPLSKNKKMFLHYGDMTDSISLNMIIGKIKPDEIYNLAAQSHVAVSFETPEYTANVDALGTLRVLESVKNLNLVNKTKIYQASTSELYGNSNSRIQNEKTIFQPRSPYAIAKLYSFWICKNYREAYGMFICNGILFNHESERRGETFVTRKITQSLAKISHGKQKILYIGNLNSVRDWGHAKDFVQMQWLMLQQKKPEDYVIATGVKTSVRSFIEKCCRIIGIKIMWKGKGLKEVGYAHKINKNFNSKVKVGDIIIKVNKKYFRPTEVNSLCGDSSKARKKLKWKPKMSVNSIIKEMMMSDIEIFK